MVAVQYTTRDILDILSAIKDPEIPVLSIEDIGMLRSVHVTDDGCEVVITPTYTGCPAMGIIQQDIIATLRQHGVPNPVVRTAYAPAWTTDWMTAETREKLREYGIAAPAKSCGDAEATPQVACPRCHSTDTIVVSRFGSTACKALYSCRNCLEPFDYFKCH